MESPIYDIDKIDNVYGSLKHLEKLQKQHLENPFIAYLNINSLRGDKRFLLTDILTNIPNDIICILANFLT